MSEKNIPEIVTVDTLNMFKNELLSTLGLTVGNKSIIQNNNINVKKTATSAVFGSNHAVNLRDKAGLKNVLISGMGNIASTWNQTVLGQFNAEDDSNAIFVIGTGTSDTNRHSAFRVLKNGKVEIDGCTLHSSSDKLVSDQHIKYTGEITSFDSLSALNTFLNSNFDENDLIPAKIIMELLTKISDSNGTSLETFTTALAEAKIELKNELTDHLNNNIQPRLSDATAIALNNKIVALQKEMSYLLSCLTVKRTDSSGVDEYFTVGLADAALDMNTVIELPAEEV